jgi:hypothetical protein
LLAKGKPVPTPHQVRGRLFPDHALKAKFSCPISAISDLQKKFLTATPNQWFAASRPASTQEHAISRKPLRRESRVTPVNL